jgi:hypothetical protein
MFLPCVAPSNFFWASFFELNIIRQPVGWMIITMFESYDYYFYYFYFSFSVHWEGKNPRNERVFIYFFFIFFYFLTRRLCGFYRPESQCTQTQQHRASSWGKYLLVSAHTHKSPVIWTVIIRWWFKSTVHFLLIFFFLFRRIEMLLLFIITSRKRT